MWKIIGELVCIYYRFLLVRGHLERLLVAESSSVEGVGRIYCWVATCPPSFPGLRLQGSDTLLVVLYLRYAAALDERGDRVFGILNVGVLVSRIHLLIFQLGCDRQVACASRDQS